MARSALAAFERERTPELHSAAKLRVCERVLLGFFAYSTILALELHLSLAERAIVLALNILASAVVVYLSRMAEARTSSFLLTVRDWFPTVLILLAYRESGLFFSPDPTHRLDQLFVRWDAVLLRSYWIQRPFVWFAPWLHYYLEVAYLLCYPLVPLGLGCLLLGRRKLRSEIVVDHFWTAVLLATLFCYAVYPFFPLTPPRLLFHDLPGPPVLPLLRRANFWLLDTYGVQACIFPSGHVAAVAATALVLRAYRPRLGVLFIVVAASVAAATVFLRYHYAVDALAGALVGWGAAHVSRACLAGTANLSVLGD